MSENIHDRIEFLEGELAYVQGVRKTRKSNLLRLVPFATEREREILAEIQRLQAESEPLLATGTSGHAGR